MLRIDMKKAVLYAPLLMLASVAPIAFPLAQAGYASLHDLALLAILPSAILLMGAMLGSQLTGNWRQIARVLFSGAMAGALATGALELVRYPGFRLGYMPGNLPELMGVLLLDQFALGPSAASTIAGYAYHVWNGASFGIIFALLADLGIFRKEWIWTTGYGILIGIGFMVSPVVQSLGVGIFGIDFGPSFAATVILAHAAFGLAYGPSLQLGEGCVCESESEVPARQVHAGSPTPPPAV